MLRTQIRIGYFCALAAVSGLIGSCAPPQDPPENLLLITIDTLRPDRLGFAGHHRPTSPQIDQLATAGARFATAYSQAGWTLPSIATILTGRHPQRHGAIEVNHPIDPELPTLATILQQSGYDTRGFVSHIMLSRKHGLAAGFDVFDASVLDVGHPHKVSTAGELTDRVLETLPSGDRPFFIWVHYFDPHFDYLEHEPWSHWGAREIDRYDGEIALTDLHMSRLIEGLEEAGLMERTLTVMTADHGEAFGERGTRHHFSTFEEVVRIPLVFHGPTVPQTESSNVAQQIDLLPTILELLDLSMPDTLPGRNLLAAEGVEPDVFIERFRPRPYIQQAIIRGSKKLIKIDVAEEALEHPDRLERAYQRLKIGPGIFLYDLQTDPGETKNLFSADDPAARELLTALEQHFADSALGAGELEVDEETWKRLEALGYLN